MKMKIRAFVRCSRKSWRSGACEVRWIPFSKPFGRRENGCEKAPPRSNCSVDFRDTGPGSRRCRQGALKGKTVGIGNFGGTDEVTGRMMLKSFGLDTDKDLKFIALGPDRARLAALKEGLVDVAGVVPPRGAPGEKIGFKVVLKAYWGFVFFFIGIGANPTTHQKKTEKVKKKGKTKTR